LCIIISHDNVRKAHNQRTPAEASFVHCFGI
jgi:hypothetical protein